jgi:hypothetical protein
MTAYLTAAEVDHACRPDRALLLEAALYQPQTGHYADLIEEAAALWESLA